MIVRARVKPPELLPEWYKCCEKIAEVHQKEYDSGTVFTVETSQSFNTLEIRCQHCGSLVAENKAGMAIIEKPNFFLLVDLYDLDEGPAA